MTRTLGLFLAAAVVLLAALPATASAQSRTVVDVAGRTVTLPEQVDRIVLGEGRLVSAIAILDREAPLRRVVGMMGDFAVLDPDGYALWREAYPEIEGIEAVGQVSPDSFSVEKTIALDPDLVVFGLAGHGPGTDHTTVLAQLEAAGIPVIFTDFFLDPLTNTPPSMALLGEALGRHDEAAAFLKANEAARERILTALEGVTERPDVFLENRVGLGLDCCASVGHGVLATMIEAAGGRNMAQPLIPGRTGIVSIEYLLTNQPDVYIGTAIGSRAADGHAAGRIVLGPGVPADLARQSFADALDRTGVRDLDAVRTGRAHAVWHHFFHGPFNVVALHLLAKWIHPEVFADLDPTETLEAVMLRFQPVALHGTYWTDAP
ncbi:periplasmic binding protein [Caenispirillum salinarum AK4]|uniref:Periplasmic binding protein n=1 Tax=Caenispirillum salinarum AK4 TaxID=1238182 RepID=K9GXW6_9PROT|nr:ABC transporter substrate-binding protein [Caenispirillum salinarum]EKV30092.1 periplasmic binding protein [Caenispirillum salinarum AK4]